MRDGTSIKDSGSVFAGIQAVPADPGAQPHHPAALRVLFQGINGINFGGGKVLSAACLDAVLQVLPKGR